MAENQQAPSAMSDADLQAHLAAAREAKSNGKKATKGKGNSKPYRKAYGCFVGGDKCGSSLLANFSPRVQGTGAAHAAKLTQGNVNLIDRIAQFEGLVDKPASELIAFLNGIYDELREDLETPSVDNADLRADYDSAHDKAEKKGTLTGTDGKPFGRLSFEQYCDNIAKL